MAKTAKDKAKEFRERMALTHERALVWIPRPIYEQAMELAVEKGWIADTGRRAGSPDIQKTVSALLEAGLLAYDSGIVPDKPDMDASALAELVHDLQKQVNELKLQVQQSGKNEN